MKRKTNKPKGQCRCKSYSVTKDCNVWMTDEQSHISAARAVAVDAMRALGLDETDFRTRDKIIDAIWYRVDGMLDHISDSDNRP